MTRDVTPRFKAPKQPRARHWSNTVPYKSERRAGQKELRERLCERVLARDGHACRAQRSVPTVACGGRLDVHEIIPRSAWRAGWLVMSNTLTVCRNHHDWIGDHPTEAHRLGLHGFSWEAPTARKRRSA